MLKCSKCKRVTRKGEPTGTIKKYRTWSGSRIITEGEEERQERTEHKDLSQTSPACLRCSND